MGIAIAPALLNDDTGGKQFNEMLSATAKDIARFERFKLIALGVGNTIRSADFVFAMKVSSDDGCLRIVPEGSVYADAIDYSRNGMTFKVTAAAWGPLASEQTHGEIPHMHTEKLWQVTAESTENPAIKIKFNQFDLKSDGIFVPHIELVEKAGTVPDLKHASISDRESLLARAIEFDNPLTQGEQFTCAAFANAFSFEPSHTASGAQNALLFVREAPFTPLTSSGANVRSNIKDETNTARAAQIFEVVTAGWGEDMARNRWVVTAKNTQADEIIRFAQYDLAHGPIEHISIQRTTSSSPT